MEGDAAGQMEALHQELTGHALFVDKAAALQALCAPGARVHMLVGFDTWIRITDPKYYGEGQVCG